MHKFIDLLEFSLCLLHLLKQKDVFLHFFILHGLNFSKVWEEKNGLYKEAKRTTARCLIWKHSNSLWSKCRNCLPQIHRRIPQKISTLPELDCISATEWYHRVKIACVCSLTATLPNKWHVAIISTVGVTEEVCGESGVWKIFQFYFFFYVTWSKYKYKWSHLFVGFHFSCYCISIPLPSIYLHSRSLKWCGGRQAAIFSQG